MPTIESPPMELSRRVAALKPSATLAVSARIGALRAEGIDVIGFGAGEPDFDTPADVRRSAIDALDAGQTHYMPVPGPPEARRVIADKLRRENGIECDPAHVVITVGAKHAIFLAMQCLLDPGRGQQVVLLTPAWVSYRPMVEVAGGEVVEVPGPVDRDFKVTPEALEAAINEKTAAVVVNSPSNPCGIAYTPAEIRGLADVLARHPHVTVIADEIYEKLIYAGTEHLSLGSLDSIASRVVTINGLSKAYAMTGWRIGYLCAPGGDGVLAKAATRLQSQMTSNITSFCYASIAAALEGAGEDVERMRRTFARRADVIMEEIDRWPDVVCPRPTGAFYVFPDVGAHFGSTTPGGRRIDSAVSFAEALLEEARVGVVPGDDFGECARTHIRLSFACGEEQIREGCRRIEAWLGTLKR